MAEPAAWRSEGPRNEDPTRSQALRCDRRHAPRVRVPAGGGTFRSKRVVGADESRSGGTGDGGRIQLELQHGWAAQARSYDCAVRAGCGARGRREHAQLSGLHEEPAYPGPGAYSARGYDFAGAWTDPNFVSGDCGGAADRMRKPCGIAVSSISSTTTI